MDLNFEYAAHQRAIMAVEAAPNDDERLSRIEEASQIATRISVFQHRLGAAAACAWSKAQFGISEKPSARRIGPLPTR